MFYENEMRAKLRVREKASPFAASVILSVFGAINISVYYIFSGHLDAVTASAQKKY